MLITMYFVGRPVVVCAFVSKSLPLPLSLRPVGANRIARLISSTAIVREEFPGLNIITENRIQTIKFNRPGKKNAFNAETYYGLASGLKEAANDDAVSVTVLTGEGDFYSSGQQFVFSTPDNIEELLNYSLEKFQEFVAALIEHPKLVVAVVNGPAIGAAVTTLGLCDVVFSSDKAWFRTPFTSLGLAPEGCSSYTFPRILGPMQAGRLLQLGETLSAEEVQQRGLVTQVFPRDQLELASSTRITEYSKLPLQATKSTKSLIRGWDKTTLHRVNQEEIRVLKIMSRSEHFYSAVTAFLNKKKI